MDKNNVTYCLLCARLKCFSKLIHLQSDEEKLRKVVEKLSRFNIIYTHFEEIVPKTVCSNCIENLDKAFEFVVGVEKAQLVLSNIYKKKIKNEKCSSEEDQKSEILDNKSDCSTRIKKEFDSQSFDEISAMSADIKIKCEPQIDKVIDSLTSSDVLSLKYLKLTWNDFLWTCAYCETQFSTIEELKIHSMQYHQCCNAYKCNDCNIRKFHLKRFIVHVKKHRKYLKLVCYKCNGKFIFARQLHMHMRNKHGPTTEYVCLGCNGEFQSLDDLNEHNRMFNRDKHERMRDIPMALKSNSLTCVVCMKTFKTKGTLNTHLLIHTERKREHICEKCGKCFLNKQNLAGHMLMHDNIRPYHCEICKSSFKTSKQLKSHVAIHNNEKPHTCDQCGRGFRLPRQLNSHKIIHTDSLPYDCSYCNKKFRFKSILNQHLRQHTGVKPYSCDVCKRDFTNWPNYNKHMKRRHGLDKAKKKRTPEGVYPINPSTGEIVRLAETNETLEWKNQILQKRDKARPPPLHITCKEASALSVENNKSMKFNSI